MNSKDKKSAKGFWRENVEALTFAVIMAVVIKQFAFEAYKVPTQSMEPTIIGRDFGGSRLIANKFTYMLREPERWEVMIFHYPHNRMLNYVKRGVGVGPEWLFLRGGDLYRADFDLDRDAALAAAKVLRKPRKLQARLFDQNNCIPPDRREVEHFRNYWVHEKGIRAPGLSPDFEEEVIRIDGSKEPVRVRFTRPSGELGVIGSKDRVICNRRFDDWSVRAPATGTFSQLLGLPFPVSGEGLDNPVPVGDMRIQLEVKPAAEQGMVLFEIRDFAHKNPIVVTIAVDGSSATGSLKFGDVRKDIKVGIPADEWTTVSVANWDDHIEVLIDDEVVLEHDYTHSPTIVSRTVLSNSQLVPQLPVDNGSKSVPSKKNENAVFWGFGGGKADFREIELSRDNYYTESGATDFHIPADNFLMLGDNSPDSLDGRSWRVSEMRYLNDDGEEILLVGDAEAVSESPIRLSSNPFDGNTKFLDIYGNLHEIDPDRIVLIPNQVGDGIEEMIPARIRLGNFVPRRFIQGRAYLTFFPLLQIGPIH